MPETTGRQQTRLSPAPAWTVLTDGPLKGLALAREAGTILAWDERDQLYLLDIRGRHRSVSHAPNRVIAGAISDCGTLIALLGEGARLWLFGADLDLLADRPAPPDAVTLAIDPHGRYIVVGTRLCLNQFYNRHGRQAGRFETRQALVHLAFVPDRPFLLGAATYGLLAGIELRAASGGGAGRLAAEVAWEEALMSNVGRLTTTGDGGMVLASCFAHGVQRYDMKGHNEGAYHLGGTVAHAAPDFAGRTIAVATLEGELAVLSAAGHVRWKTNLPRAASALETDPLGRYLIYGHATGEIVRLDLYAGENAAAQPAPEVTVASRAGPTSLREPDWSAAAASSDEQAESAVLAVLDDPPRIGLLTNANRLQVFTSDGRNLGHAPEITGIGRILRTAPGWIAGATDRQIVLYDALRNSAQRVDLSLVEITHLAIRPDTYGLCVVQERDRVGRATLSGRWVWKRELPSPIEELAIGSDGSTAMSTNDGKLLILDPAGATLGEVAGDANDPLLLIEAPDGAPEPVAWLTLARRAQVLAGHNRVGKVVWRSPVPWEGWMLHRVGPLAVVSAPDGRAQAYDAAGRLVAQSRASDITNDLFASTAQGNAWRVSRQGVHLICSDLADRIKWRAVSDQHLGPVAAGRTGVAILLGRTLAWFGSRDD